MGEQQSIVISWDQNSPASVAAAKELIADELQRMYRDAERTQKHCPAVVHRWSSLPTDARQENAPSAPLVFAERESPTRMKTVVWNAAL